MSKSTAINTEIPGPKSRKIMRKIAQHTPSALAHLTPIVVDHAQGALLTDVDGNTFIDFAGGIGVMNVGHGAPAVVEALKEQSEKLLHTCFMVVAYESYADLCAKLNKITPGDSAKQSVLFNSGAEAVENAVKIARAYTGRSGVIAFDRAFHGRTMFSLGLTGQIKPYKSNFGPFPDGIQRVPFPYEYRCPIGRQPCQCDLSCIHPLEQMFRSDVSPNDVAAIIVEPILGEGGFVVPPREFFPKLMDICKEHGIVFIADEVQTGFGRTGKMFAMDHLDIEPDLLVSAKSLAAGMPLSAVTGKREIMSCMEPGALGGTYGGNPLACRAALAAIETIEKDGLLERAQKIGVRTYERFLEMQGRSPLIGEVRGLGAMVAMELVKDRSTREPASEATSALIKACYSKGLIILKSGASGNVVRTLMPLTISDDQLNEGLSILESALIWVSEMSSIG